MLRCTVGALTKTVGERTFCLSSFISRQVVLHALIIHLGSNKLFQLATDTLLLLGRVWVVDHSRSVRQGIVHQQLLRKRKSNVFVHQKETGRRQNQSERWKCGDHGFNGKQTSLTASPTASHIIDPAMYMRSG